MDKFKPKEFDWDTIHYSGIKLDLSKLQIYEEKEILTKLHEHSHLDSINALTLAENNLTSIPYESLLLVKTSLENLNLEGNNFFVNYNVMEYQKGDIPIAWARFPNMINLEVLNLANCNIQSIIPDIFKNITNLRSLSLAKNNIIKISVDAFLKIPNLIHLDLSSMNSYLNNDDLLSVESYFELMEVGGISIDEFTFNSLTQLEYINFSKTRISHKTKALHHFRKSLKYLGLCSSSIQMLDNQIFTNGNLQVIDLSYNPYVAINLNNNSFNGLEKSLKVLWLAESAIKNVFWLKKLQNIEYLNLAVNNINSLTNQTFSSMNNLRYLDLSSNHIGNWYHQIFAENKLLKILNFQENNINMITPEMYKDFKKMDFLALSKNNFVCYCYLRSLIDHAEQNGRDKAKDFINYLNREDSLDGAYHMMRKVLIEQYYNQYVESQMNLKNSSTLDHLRPLDQKPQTLYFQLLDYNEEDYWCYSGSKYLKLNDVSYCRSSNLIENEELNETAKFIICGFVVFIVVSLFFTIIYFKKNKIKKIIQKIKKLFGITTKGKNLKIEGDQSCNEIYKYDVFVSYSDHDRDWILEELIPNMDSDKELKICLHEREFKVGLTIWENIIHHMDKSRSLLLVISNSFLQSNWCQFEMKFAQKRIFETKKNQLVLVLLEEIPKNRRPKSLQHLMDLRTYIKWPNLTGNTEKDVQLKDTFWNRIKKSLKTD